MQSNTKFIIGGGFSGLAFQFYHPEFTIITPDTGGQYGKNYLIWLHDLPETRKLLQDLHLPVKPKKSYIAYEFGGMLYEKISEEQNLLVIQKKMSLWNEPIKQDFNPQSREMSTTTIDKPNYLTSLDIDLNEVIKRLSDKARTEHGVVTKITNVHIEIDGTIGRSYTKLVSTIAAPLFWKAYSREKTFESIPITNIVSKTKPEYSDDQFEMVYYTTMPYSRTSKMTDVWAYEFTGFISKEEIEKFLPGIDIQEYFVTKYGRIIETENKEPTEDITFLGRFAQWKFGITSEHVLKKILEYV